MKKLILVLSLILVANISDSQNLEYAKAVVKKLASPELHGRGYTVNGNAMAADFIVGEFKRFGLVPCGTTFYQKFEIPINTYPKEMLLKLNDETLQPGVDYLIESSSPGIKGKYKVIKVNKNELTSEEKLIALIKKAGSNFIFIDETAKESEDKDLNKKIDDFIAYLKFSPKISCKGIIEFTKEKLTWDNSMMQNPRPIFTINKTMDVSNIHSVELNIDCKFIKSYETQNIVGCIKGSVYPDSLIVVTAHYDHLGQMGKETYFPGANDNASGVAMILNLAEYYSKNRPKNTIVFIALSAEEVGIIGAKEFTDNPLIILDRIKFLVNFDLAGTGDEGIKVVNGSVFKTKFNLLSKLNTEYNFLPKVASRGEACNSDHCLFYQKGVPCFYIYTLGGIAAYHDVYDKYETLPFTGFIGYCSLMIRFFDAL